MSEAYTDKFRKDGFIVVEGLFDPHDDIEPIREAYTQLIDALAYIYMVETDFAELESYVELPLPDRFAILLGASGGAAMHHLDPILNIFLPNYRHHGELPSAQIAALFNFIRHSKLLDVLELLIGSELFASPIYHVNLKLAKKHLERVEMVAKSVNQDNLAQEGFYNFQVGKTDWHMDAISGLSDSHESQIVNAWIPITEARRENGCLLVIPGSHKFGVLPGASDEMIERAVALEVSPGDIVILDNKLLHSATSNTSVDDYRWAFNFRYLPIGQTSGRPFLPGFIARSRNAPHTELHNPYIWSAMWDRALEHRVEHRLSYSYAALRAGEISDEEAKSITAHWQELAPDPCGWLCLGREKTSND